MRVIILAAGQSKRYQDAGYETPKPFLKVKWRGITMLMIEHVAATVPLRRMDQVYFAINQNTYHNAYHPNVVVGHTRGPADTALVALCELDKTNVRESTLFMDCDILNSTNDLDSLINIDTCGVLVHKNHSSEFSYVDKLGTFYRIVEKKCISQWAVCGAYFISKDYIGTFMSCAAEVITSTSEPYLSHVFNYMVASHKEAIHTLYPPVDWGTPEKLLASGAEICT